MSHISRREKKREEKGMKEKEKRKRRLGREGKVKMIEREGSKREGHRT